jgi:hypothetical protein
MEGLCGGAELVEQHLNDCFFIALDSQSSVKFFMIGQQRKS